MKFKKKQTKRNEIEMNMEKWNEIEMSISNKRMDMDRRIPPDSKKYPGYPKPSDQIDR